MINDLYGFIAYLEKNFSEDGNTVAAVNELKEKADELSQQMREASNNEELSIDEQLVEGLKGMGDFSVLLYDTVKVLTEGVMSVVEVARLLGPTLAFLDASNYVNTSATAAGTVTEGAGIGASGSFAYLVANTQSQFHIGKNSHFESLQSRLEMNSTALTENYSLLGHLNDLGGIKLPAMDQGTGVGGTLLISHTGSLNDFSVGENTQLKAKTDLHLGAYDSLNIVNVAASAGINTGDFNLEGLTAVTVLDGDNQLRIDDEAQLISDESITLEAKRDDNVQTIAGTVSMRRTSILRLRLM